MKNLLSPSTKAKIGVGLIALMTMFGFNSCTNPTGSNGNGNSEELPHPDKIGVINGIEIRASFTITPEQETDLLTRLQIALQSNAVLQSQHLPYLTMIELTGPGSGNPVALPGGVISGVVSLDPETGLMTWIMSALSGGFPVAHNATEEKMLLADLEERKAAADLRIASRMEQRIVL